MSFRKSKKFGIFRINFTGKGMSMSAGVPGARVSVNSKGDVRRTVSVPGSGWYDTKKIGSLKQETKPRQTFTLPEQPGCDEGPLGISIAREAFRLSEGGKDTDIPKSMITNLRRSGSVVNMTLTDANGSSQTLPFHCGSVEEATELRAALAWT